MWSAVASPVVVGLVAITTSRTGPPRDPVVELGDAQILGGDPVDRRQRAAEHVVAPGELVRALDRDHIRGLLDHADELGIAPLVGADPADRPVREVEARLAQPDPLLDLPDRLGERKRLLVGGAKEVEGQPLGGATADSRELGQLGDQPLDRRGVRAQRGLPLEAREPEPAEPTGERAELRGREFLGRPRRPSFTAASTMSESSSTSSGSTADGSIVISLIWRSPLTLTLTIPPPAEASTTSSLSASCAASMSACIF